MEFTAAPILMKEGTENRIVIELGILKGLYYWDTFCPSLLPARNRNVPTTSL